MAESSCCTSYVLHDAPPRPWLLLPSVTRCCCIHAVLLSLSRFRHPRHTIRAHSGDLRQDKNTLMHENKRGGPRRFFTCSLAQTVHKASFAEHRVHRSLEPQCPLARILYFHNL